MQTLGIIRLLAIAISASSLFLTSCSQPRQVEEPTATPTQPEPPIKRERTEDVPYVPTPDVVVERMLELAEVSEDDLLYDLGSGDGRIAIAAAQEYGARSTGVEINPGLVQLSQDNAEAANVGDRVKFVQQDLFDVDLSDATVLTLYLLPDINLRLRPKLFQELEPGTRIVSHDFDMGQWQPQRMIQVQGPDRVHTLYYWVVPEDVPESWS